MTNKIKVLLLDPGPIGLAYLRLDEELREIENKIQASPCRDLFELIPRSSVRVSDLGTFLLRHKPHIVHFIGHADPSTGIILEDDAGFRTSVGATDLANILHALKDNIRAVFLSVCYTKAYAEALAQKIDFVIGMDDVISEQAAIVFAGSFYQALAYRRSVKDAFEIAKAQLNIRSLAGAEAPVLLIRQGVRESEPLLSQENCYDYAERVKANGYSERCEDVRTRLVDGIVESLKDRRQDQPDQGEEVWRWQSEDAAFKATAILERNGGLTFNFSSSELGLEGSRIKFRLGPMSHEFTLQRVSESEISGRVEILRRQLPRNLADISIELI